MSNHHNNKKEENTNKAQVNYFPHHHTKPNHTATAMHTKKTRD